MILVDTSVWIDHFRYGDATLADLLTARQVIAHPFVIGELALGNLHDREVILSTMRKLPQAAIVRPDELLHFIKQEALSGLGIGYVDAHLLAAARLTPGTSLWTRDKRLHAAAGKLGLAPAGLPGMSIH